MLCSFRLINTCVAAIVVASAGAWLGGGGSAAAADDASAKQNETQGPQTRPVQTDSAALLSKGAQPVDERINQDKITEYDPPPLPEQVVLPMPPTFQIAPSQRFVPIDKAHYDKARAAIDDGLAYLRSTQDDSGGWMTHMRAAPTDQPDKPSPIAVAVTALAVKAFVQEDRDWANTEAGVKALRFIESAQNDDGSFEGGALSNYVTSSVVMALASVGDQDDFGMLHSGVEWLKSNQWDQTEGLNGRQDWFGGAGYGNHGRPDLSNTQMMLDALYDAGISPDEPVMQKALAFVSRAQNLKQTNKAEWAGNDGGFIYTPANGGESEASELHEDEDVEGEPRSLRSYGSMTYAGFKSMLYAGLSPDDVRVRAAFDWIRRHWTFDENPGLGLMGLYYYYHTLSRALYVAQQHEITDVHGETHNWRAEMINAITRRQNDDGSWKNSAERWLEGQPDLATIYSVLALEETIKPALNLTAKTPDE